MQASSAKNPRLEEVEEAIILEGNAGPEVEETAEAAIFKLMDHTLSKVFLRIGIAEVAYVSLPSLSNPSRQL